MASVAFTVIALGAPRTNFSFGEERGEDQRGGYVKHSTGPTTKLKFTFNAVCFSQEKRIGKAFGYDLCYFITRKSIASYAFLFADGRPSLQLSFALRRSVFVSEDA
eukprot:5410542-Amphidinium_carterae.1